MTARWAATTTSQQTATGRQHLLVPAMFSVFVRLSSLLFFSLCRLCVSVCICVTGKTTRDMMKTIRGVKLRGTKSRQPQKQTRRAKLLQRRHKGTATCDRLPSPRSKNEKFRECTQELAAGSQVNRDYNNTNAYFSGALKEGNHSPRLNQTRRDTSHRMILERVFFSLLREGESKTFRGNRSIKTKSVRRLLRERNDTWRIMTWGCVECDCTRYFHPPPFAYVPIRLDEINASPHRWKPLPHNFFFF